MPFCLRVPQEPTQSLPTMPIRSEEHTSELQSRPHLVCRLLLEKKKIDYTSHYSGTLPIKLVKTDHACKTPMILLAHHVYDDTSMDAPDNRIFRILLAREHIDAR